MYFAAGQNITRSFVWLFLYCFTPLITLCIVRYFNLAAGVHLWNKCVCSIFFWNETLKRIGYNTPLKIAFIIRIMQTHLPKRALQVSVIQNNIMVVYYDSQFSILQEYFYDFFLSILTNVFILIKIEILFMKYGKKRLHCKNKKYFLSHAFEIIFI